MMGNKQYRNGTMNAPLKWRAPMRSPPSTKASATATGGITKAATVGIKNWFERGQSPLSSSMQEIMLLYNSASNMMAIKHNTKSGYAKNAVGCWRWWACSWSPCSCSAPCTQRTCEGWWLHLPGGGPKSGNNQLAIESKLMGK